MTHNIMGTIENCPLCGKVADHIRGPREITVGKRRVTVEDDYLYCSHCEEQFYSAGQLADLQRQTAARIRDEEGLLTPQEIRAVRERLSLTQAEFERLLGTGAKTVVRWEKGTVFQSRTTDRLIRLLDNVPEAVEFLSHHSGQPVAEFPTDPAVQFVASVSYPPDILMSGGRSYWLHSGGPAVQSRAALRRPVYACEH